MPKDPRPAREWRIPRMDKESGWTESAFTWAMGRLILQRIAEGDTMREITAPRRMPAYCTVYRWMQVVPEFGAAAAELRGELARQRRDAADARRRTRGRRRRGGQREQVPAALLSWFLYAVREGLSTSEAASRPGAPSLKVIYSRVRKCPGFRLAFTDACEWRDLMLECERERIIGWPGERRQTNAALREVDGRRGRLRPKLYRVA